jgi:hypothetical protein
VRKQLLQDFKGLVTAPGLLSRAEASCIEANNLVMDAPGVVRKRRGFARQPGGTGGPCWQVMTSRLFGDNVLVSFGTSSGASGLRYGDGSSPLTAVNAVDGSNFTRPPEARMRLALSGLNHYLTSDEGVRRWEATESGGPSGSVHYAGMPAGAPFAATLVAGTVNPVAAGSAVAYRATFHVRDASGVELGGPPTGRCVVKNVTGMDGFVSGSARAVNVQIPLPRQFGTANTALTTSWYFRLWRTRVFNLTFSEPDDEMFLVAERYLTPAEIAAGVVAVTDDTPDSYLVGSPRLHTNVTNFPPGEENATQGILNADEAPPRANDIAEWASCLWYADIDYRPSLFFTLLSVPAEGVTLTIGGTVYTARATPSVSTDFRRYTGFTSALDNLRRTVESLCAVINSTSTTVYAYPVSNTGQFPGGVLVVSRNFTNFSAQASVSGITRPELVGGQYGVSNQQRNALAYSKPRRADAVPPQNVLTVGPAGSRILRIVPFRDMLVVFSDAGIYRVTGQSWADFAVSPFDLSYRLLAPESVVTCDDRLYAWCYEGIVEIDYGGVRVISTPIEPTLEALFGDIGFNHASFSVNAFAVAYRRAHRVLFFYPSDNPGLGLYGCTKWLAFDTRTRAWTTGAVNDKPVGSFFYRFAAGVVRFSDDRLVLVSWRNTPTDSYLFLERRSYAVTDYRDDDWDGTTRPIASALTLQWQQPDATGAQHWQRVTLHFDAGEYAWRTAPSQYVAVLSTEHASVNSGSVSVSGGRVSSTLEVPRETRRGQRFRLRVTHNVDAEYFGLVGVEFLLADEAPMRAMRA